IPPYFGRPECTTTATFECEAIYLDTVVPLHGDALRIRLASATADMNSVHADITWAECDESYDKKTLLFERMHDGHALPPLKDIKAPALTTWPPPVGQRARVCSPVKPNIYAFAESFDLTGGRVVGWRADQKACVFNLTSQKCTVLQGDANGVFFAAS